jgi:uncharacterized protein (TIRG00374 family)
MDFFRRNKKSLIGIATTLASTILLFLCFRKVDWRAFLQNIEGIQIPYLLLGFLTTFTIILIKSLQIRIYLPREKKIPYFRVFQVVAILLMMVSILPFWGGHALFVYLLGKREKVGAITALSVVTLDQVLDGFGKVAVLGAAALIVPLPDWMKDGIRGLVLLVFVAYSITFFLAYRYKNFSPPAPSSRPLWIKLRGFFYQWASNLKTLRDPGKISAVIFLSVLMRVIETLAVFWVQKSFGLELPLSASILVVAALSLATVLPVAPGRLGVFEAAVFSTYRGLGLDPTLAAVLALFVHLVHSLPLILTGYAMALKTGFHRREVVGMEQTLPPRFAASRS